MSLWKHSIWRSGQGGIGIPLAWKNEVNNKIKKLYEDDANVLLTTTGSTDLQTAIDNLLSGQILEIQTNATYDPIIISSGKSFSIRVKRGYNPKITGARCIRLNNKVADIIISGLTIENMTNTGGNNNYTGTAITFGQHQTIVNNIIFHNLKIKDTSTGSAVLLSYHWSVNGDQYYNPPQLNELSEKIAFIDCTFSRSCKDGTEGANILIRGAKEILIDNCYIDNYNDAGRGILGQGILNFYCENNIIYNIGGGNAEGIKVDQIGISPFLQTCVITNNYIDTCIEGIDIDDNVSALVINNLCKNCTDEGISLDNDSQGVFSSNICYDCTSGIRFETGSLGFLISNNCFNNQNNYRMDNGYTPDQSNISDSSIIQETVNYQKTKTLVEATLTNVLDIFVGNNKSAGVKLRYKIEAINTGSNTVECHYGEFMVIARNQNGVITNANNHPASMELDLPVGTGITDVFGIVNGTGKVTVNLTATSGITPTSLILYYMIELFGDQQNISYKEL